MFTNQIKDRSKFCLTPKLSWLYVFIVIEAKQIHYTSSLKITTKLAVKVYEIQYGHRWTDYVIGFHFHSLRTKSFKKPINDNTQILSKNNSMFIKLCTDPFIIKSWSVMSTQPYTTYNRLQNTRHHLKRSK